VSHRGITNGKQFLLDMCPIVE